MKFLEQIADYYTSPHHIGELQDITFVFPNKRSAMFLKLYIQQRLKAEYSLMPRFTTFARLASDTVRMPEASHNELLFMLYRTYISVITATDPERKEQVRDFDRFIFWGDMILSDFDDIDRSLADPHKLYSNLRALHEITADYLTDEQKDLIRRIWGETNLTEHVDTFWLHTSPADSESELTRKFISLWQILADIYEEFRSRLRKAGLSTPGMIMRDALGAFKNMLPEDIRRRHYVFVGMSDLTNAEIAIMERISQAGAADFFWDLASPAFYNPDGKINTDNKALRIISTLAKIFKSPDDFKPMPLKSLGTIDIYGIPSSVGQAKFAGNLITKLAREGRMDDRGSFNTAIVVPDPSQLMPLMLSLPDSLPALNVTMGIPYSTTTFATLMRAVVMMQRRARKRRNGTQTYFFQDVLEVLVHPHLQLLAPGKANAVRQYIYDQRLFNIDAARLASEFKELAFIFSPIGSPDNLEDTYNYITGLINGLKDALSRSSAACSFDKPFEMEILSYFDRNISELRRLIDKYSITMQESTLLALFERILQSKVINVEGTPLRGLQVMGVLETRNLDFDNIIFLSMNERTFPRRDYVRTMIPNNLRHGFGLPPIEQSESFYAYNFFRAISRASHVSLIYDTRPPGRGAGEMSRYLSQLFYLYGDSGDITHRRIALTGAQPAARTIAITKTQRVMEQLDEFKKINGPRISASALKTFMKCPLCFYLQYVNGLRDDDEPVDYLDAARLGDVFHRSAKRIYDSFKGQPITADMLTAFADSDRLSSILVSELAEMAGMDKDKCRFSDLSYESMIIHNQTAAQLRSMLITEASQYCVGGAFEYVEGEMDINNMQWEVTPGLKVNFRMQIDRVDRIAPDLLRFIDYKTGSDSNKAGASMANLFQGDHSRNAIFQLLVYAEAYHDLVDPNVRILPALHIIKDIVREGVIAPITYDKAPMQPFPALSDEFRPLLNQLFIRIFDPDEPFYQTTDTNDCKYCPFLSICGRTLPPDFN